MKKFISLVLAAAMILCLAPSAFAALRGDVNGDSKVTSSDALLVLQYAVGQTKTIDKVRADVDSSGTINSGDALIILQICVGLLPSSDAPTTAAEIVELYNKALKTTYYKSKLTVKYTDIDSGVIADLTAKKETPYNDKNSRTAECINGIDQLTKLKIDESQPGCTLDPKGVKSASVQQNSDGTRTIKIELNEEKTDIFKLPVYNKQAAMAFVYTDEVLSGTTTYTGTTLTLVVNSKNEAVSLNIKMPYICEYQKKVSGTKHSMKDTGCTEYTATYTF